VVEAAYTLVLLLPLACVCALEHLQHARLTLINLPYDAGMMRSLFLRQNSRVDTCAPPTVHHTNIAMPPGTTHTLKSTIDVTARTGICKAML
jgi:hypothetical protein